MALLNVRILVSVDGVLGVWFDCIWCDGIEFFEDCVVVFCE